MLVHVITDEYYRSAFNLVPRKLPLKFSSSFHQASNDQNIFVSRPVYGPTLIQIVNENPDSIFVANVFRESILELVYIFLVNQLCDFAWTCDGFDFLLSLEH